jgi:hypothetical protein
LAKVATLAEVRTKARLYADERPGGASGVFITDSEANTLVNGALGEFYDLLVSARGHEHYETEDDFLTTPGTANYASLSFYQLLSVHLRWSATSMEEVPALNNIADRHPFVNGAASWAEGTRKAFRVKGNTIEFFPTPTAETEVIVRFIAPFTSLTGDNDTFDGMNGWDRLVALRVAIEMRTIAGQPATFLMGLYQQERERIEELASQLAANHVAKIRDVNPDGIGADDFFRLPRATL